MGCLVSCLLTEDWEFKAQPIFGKLTPQEEQPSLAASALHLLPSIHQFLLNQFLLELKLQPNLQAEQGLGAMICFIDIYGDFNTIQCKPLMMAISLFKGYLNFISGLGFPPNLEAFHLLPLPLFATAPSFLYIFVLPILSIPIEVLDLMNPLFHLRRLNNLPHLKPTIFSGRSLLQIQAQLTTTGLIYSNPSCLLSLLNLTLSCPETLHYATAIFSHIQQSNAPTWPLMVRRLALDTDPFRIFSLFNTMQRLRRNDPLGDPYVYASLVKACNKLSAIREGKSIHCYVVRLGLDYNLNILNSLINFYSCSRNLMGLACVLFDRIPEKTIVTVNGMISGFVKNESFDAGLNLFKRILVCLFGLELKPNYVTLVILISGCFEFRRLDVGKTLHSYCHKTSLDSVTEACNALIDLYSKFKCMIEASRLFEAMVDKDLVSWNTMISGYASVGEYMRAFILFSEMRSNNIAFDRVSLISLILASGYGKEIDLVKMVHGYIIASGIEITAPVGTTLINMYSKCGSVEFARNVFFQLQDKNIASWNALVHAYVECHHDHEALEVFSQIKLRKLKPDEVTMLGVILACRNSGELYHGIDIHSYIESSSHLNQSIILQNALIDMYAKCGNMGRAKLVFDEMPRKDVISWTSVIVGYAINGQGEEACDAFRRMETENVKPNSVTFLGVLSACNHAGLVEEGQNFFHSMCMSYHIQPNIEHCGCIIDMLARSGRLEEAVKFVRNLPVGPNAVIRRMLINACKVHRDFDIGLSLIRGLKTFSHSPENHVISSNLLAEAGMWDDVLDERSLMVKQKVLKVAGKSLISELT
ncbi:pentatricopeptide repeat-containing protein At1g06140, mitochondrial-like [Cannabis sativa]|uniref:pentatricopeptide repeat-containing protein At1g06140, mitochondrial-like n=1 Tax=Cannabis sativa TaxID=3483 RepID=UPI0029C9DF86|nr:pentatricopeptide repeat-containing protein At1g06140, mitochondrial-like [Cannabis sativa]